MSDNNEYGWTEIGYKYTPGKGWESYTIGPPLKRGDRVRIREGYVDAGEVGFYVGKSYTMDGDVLVEFENEIRIMAEPCGCVSVAVDAIEPYPYSREERIERAIEDYEYERNRTFAAEIDGENERNVLSLDDERNLLFAILDAGV